MSAAARTRTAKPPMAIPAIAPPERVELCSEVATAVAAAVVVDLKKVS